MRLPNVVSRRSTCASCRLLHSSTKRSLPSHQTINEGSEVESAHSSGSIILSSSLYSTDTTQDDAKWRPLKYRRRDTIRQEASEGGQTRRVGRRDSADPFEVMATSPKRMCIVTRQVLPSSFLINLRPTYFPPDATNSTAAGLLQLLPDRILTRGRSKKGKGMWVSCHNEVIDQMINGKGPHFGTLRQFPSLTIPPNLKAIVHAQLSERVLLEMECLARRSESLLPPRGNGQGSDGFSATPYTPTLRRLTNMEAASISISSPPSSGSTLASAPSSKTILALLDISALSSPSPSNIHDGTGSQQIQQKSQKDLEVDVPLVHLTTGERTPMTDSIPLYDLSALFPHSDQHIRLLRSLRRVLSMERRNKRRLVVGRNHQSPSSFSTSQTEHPGIPYSHPEPPAGADASADSAHSDILALCSGSAGQGEHTEDDRCILGYPLFIALWRLRCFLGHGWQAS